MTYNFANRVIASTEDDELTEIDAGWFDQLGEKAQQAYIRLHPNSKYARYYRRQVKQAPTDIDQIGRGKHVKHGMKQHRKDLDYAAKYEKDPARKKAYQSELKKMDQMMQRVKDRADDEYYDAKRARGAEQRLEKETKRQQREIDKIEREEQDPRKWWEKAIGRENPVKQQPAQETPEPAQEPPKPKYTPEQLQQMMKPKLAQDVVPDSAMPPPENGPKPTNVVRRRRAPQ